MGRPLFTNFLAGFTPGAADRKRGLHWYGEFEDWNTLLARGRERARLVRPQRCYLVDPTQGLESMVSFFAVASVPDTFLLWAQPSPQFGALRKLECGWYELENTIGAIDRPLWGILTSGSSGIPKIPVGYADTLELVALHYEAGVFRRIFPESASLSQGLTHATCLPLQFSAAFFMTVLPAIMFQRDLLVFQPHDWRPLCEAAQREHVICQSVPSITSAGSLSIPAPVDMSRATLLLGAGYVTEERVRTIRERFMNVTVMNIYGTAETGAISIDPDPGHGTHVGFPMPGKPVWLQDPNRDGVGVIATIGPDCRAFYWVPGEGLEPANPVVSNVDYGHFDAAGRLYLDGRVDEGDKLNGNLVYPRVVERHILLLEGVADVRVRVIRDSEGREHLAARVIGRAQKDAIREHCRVLDQQHQPGRIECIAESEAEQVYTAHGKL